MNGVAESLFVPDPPLPVRTLRCGKGKEAIEKMFSPEFRNRLDATIFSNPLSIEIIERVVRQVHQELVSR
jgi:ATP-dependent Clp protease ATP-binding subunit ClpA